MTMVLRLPNKVHKPSDCNGFETASCSFHVHKVAFVHVLGLQGKLSVDVGVKANDFYLFWLFILTILHGVVYVAYNLVD